MNAPTKPAAFPTALRRVAAEARAEVVRVVGDPKLTDACVVASLYLQWAARRAGYELDVIAGGARARRRRGADGLVGHAWCTWGPWIVDVTASQFWRVSPVYVVRAPHPRYALSPHEERRNVGIFAWLPYGSLPTLAGHLVALGATGLSFGGGAR